MQSCCIKRTGSTHTFWTSVSAFLPVFHRCFYTVCFSLLNANGSAIWFNSAGPLTAPSTGRSPQRYKPAPRLVPRDPSQGSPWPTSRLPPRTPRSPRPSPWGSAAAAASGGACVSRGFHRVRSAGTGRDRLTAASPRGPRAPPDAGQTPDGERRAARSSGGAALLTAPSAPAGAGQVPAGRGARSGAGSAGLGARSGARPYRGTGGKAAPRGGSARARQQRALRRARARRSGEAPRCSMAATCGGKSAAVTLRPGPPAPAGPGASPRAAERLPRSRSQARSLSPKTPAASGVAMAGQLPAVRESWHPRRRPPARCEGQRCPRLSDLSGSKRVPPRLPWAFRISPRSPTAGMASLQVREGRRGARVRDGNIVPHALGSCRCGGEKVTHGAASPSVGLAGRARSGAVLGERALLSCAAAGAAATESEEEEEDEEEGSVSPHALSCPTRHRVL